GAERVVWPRSWRRNRPRLDGDLRGAGAVAPFGLGLLREGLDEVLRERSDLILRHADPVIFHHAQDRVPALARIAGPDAAQEGVAAVAIGRGRLLAGSIRQWRRGLTECRDGDEESHSREGRNGYLGHLHSPVLCAFFSSSAPLRRRLGW